MPNNFKSIADVLNKEKAFKKVIDKAKEQRVLEQFYEVFPDLKNIAKAVKNENKVLYLNVDNSVWRSELNFKQGSMIKKTNDFFGEKIINRIKFIS